MRYSPTDIGLIATAIVTCLLSIGTILGYVHVGSDEQGKIAGEVGLFVATVLSLALNRGLKHLAGAR